MGKLLENLLDICFKPQLWCVCGFRMVGSQNWNATTGLMSKTHIGQQFRDLVTRWRGYEVW
jgi:hypothetical protein